MSDRAVTQAFRLQRIPHLSLRFGYHTEKGATSTGTHDLSGLTTIDAADVEYAIANAVKELRRLDASRTFTGG